MKIAPKKGAVAPLVAVLLIFLIICVALVVDLGHVHNVKIQLQRAVDAAALAGARELPSGNYVSVAISVAAANSFDSDHPIDISEDDIEAGRWDPNNLGDTIYGGRFSPTNDDPNALLVRATTVVTHVFGIVPGWGSTDVTVDAIAVNESTVPSIPIALVSCIPTGGETSGIIEESPGLTVCDIATYKFNQDNEDTAAWTSLTYGPANDPNIKLFVEDETLFNAVIYGNDEYDTKGLENERPKAIPTTFDPDWSGCNDNIEKDINCGLGSDFDPSTPPASDPLVSYADGNSLPRWYQPQFIDLITMNGHLLDTNNLKDLYDSTDNVPEFDDYDNGLNRFETFIHLDKGKKAYAAKLSRVVDYAGYPPVWVNNGTMVSIMKAFLDRVVTDPKNVKKSGSFKTNSTGVYPPFDSENRSTSGGYGETVVLTIPVIFAGTCDEWKAKSDPRNQRNDPQSYEPIETPLHYVGLANFLLTRLFINNKCFDVAKNDGDGPLMLDGSPNCETSGLQLPLYNGTTFSCNGFKAPPTALEGLLRPPLDEEELTTVTRTYLVE